MKGAGDRAFVSGADISEFEAQRSNPETIEKYDAIGAAAGRAYGELDKPMIAMIQGYCMGGGLLTSLRADLRIASDDSASSASPPRASVSVTATAASSP